MSDLRVTADGIELQATWTGENPEVRRAVEAALPIEGEAARWGDELYVGAGLDVAPERTTEAVPVGALAYWPGGDAVCLFWGPTPASDGPEPRAAAPVGVFARVNETEPLAAVEGGARLRLERT